MFAPSELEKIPVEIQKLVMNLSIHIMEDVIDRINKIGSISRTTDYEIYRLSQIGLSSTTIRKAIQTTLNLTNAEIDKVYDEVIQEGYTRNESLYNAVGKTFIPYSENAQLQQLVNAVRMQTKDELENITRTMGFAVETNGKTEFLLMTQYYRQTLDNAVMDITSGSFDYNSTIKKVINEMTKSGVRTIDYQSGRSNRIEVAVRRAVMTGVTQVTGKITEMNMEALGTKFVEVTWHATARPSHQLWQGRVYYWDKAKPFDTKTVDGVHYKAFIAETGYGTVEGLCGVNCYHDFYGFIPGVSVRTYTDEQLEELNSKENTPKEYKGKEYTSYEATQRQRKLETLMRKQRQDIKLLEYAGADKEDIAIAKIKYRSTMEQYVDFSKKMKLPQQRERIYIN
nr:phage minor capsid protein [uncultured Anaerocolumna sp.]